MNILAFDTSSPLLTLALKAGAAPLIEKELTGTFRHSENLLPMIDEMLKAQNLALSDIDTFLIGRGPGSFTGLRVGFATLKGFIAGSPKPCYGANALDLIKKPIQAENLAVILDARGGKFFVKTFAPEKTSEIQILIASDLEKLLKSTSFTIAGEALEKHSEHFLSINSGLKFLEPEKWYPKASTLIKLFEEKDPALKLLEKPEDFLPEYYRKSEPEERRESQNA